MAHVTMALYHGPHGLWLSEGKRFPVILPDELFTQKQYAYSGPPKKDLHTLDTLQNVFCITKQDIEPIIKSLY